MKLFIASTNNCQYLEQEISRSKYLLESFYYVKPWQIPIIQNCKMFLLDSGAFTFLNAKKKGNVDWDEYLTQYINFINKYDIQYFFELDIDSVVGLQKVESLRNRLEKETGKKSIPVWHFARGKEYYINMCREYNYIAFGGIITDGIKTTDILKHLKWFSDTAHKNNCKLHALGLTCRGIETYGVDSADSTAWACSRFGRIDYFDGKGMAHFDPRKTMRIKNGKLADKYSLNEWIKYQYWLDNK